MITTRAGMDAAPKTQFSLYPGAGGQFLYNDNTSYKSCNFTFGVMPFPIVGTPAAASSGGTLWSNGSAGFFQYPATASHIYALKIHQAATLSGGSIALYDMVWGASGFVGNSGSAQAVTGFPVMTRPVSGEGLEAFLFVKTASSSTSTAITLDYTNSAGVPGRTASLMMGGGVTSLLGANTTFLPFKLQDGDMGVLSIQSLTIGTAQAVAGALWLVLGRRVAHLAVTRTYGPKACEQDAFKSGFPYIGDSAALAVVTMASGVDIQTAMELVLAHG